MAAMRELIERVINESDSRSAGGVGQECKPAPLEGKPKQEIQAKHRAVPPEPRDKAEAGDKIHNIKMELSALAKNHKEKPGPEQTIKKNPPTLMERFMEGLKRLKKWFARRRRERSTILLRNLQDKPDKLTFVLLEKKEMKAIPVYTLGGYKESVAEKIVTAIESFLKYISRAVKAVFLKRKRKINQALKHPNKGTDKNLALGAH